MKLNLFILSSKSYIELVSKDFAKNYENSITVYQNEFGYLDGFQKILSTNPEHRLFIQMNDVKEHQDKDKTILKNVILPVPIVFKNSYNVIRTLQRAFSLLKYISLQRIYRNNYNRHCVNKANIDGGENGTRINLCVLLLEHENDLNTNSVNQVFYKNLIRNFKNLSERIANPNLAKSQEEYSIFVKYGIASLKKNKGLFNLYNEYIKEKGIVPPKDKSKLLLIINDTQEKFTFKWFADEKNLNGYLADLDKPDFFEDTQFSVN
jgi:hypothetical protein